jgi:hypothetical protein
MNGLGSSYRAGILPGGADLGEIWPRIADGEPMGCGRFSLAFSKRTAEKLIRRE